MLDPTLDLDFSHRGQAGDATGSSPAIATVSPSSSRPRAQCSSTVAVASRIRALSLQISGSRGWSDVKVGGGLVVDLAVVAGQFGWLVVDLVDQ
jgi:hypothetical protein